MENDSLLRTTLVTVAAMVGACALVVGTLSLAAVLVTKSAVGPQPDSSSASSVKTTTAAPATTAKS